MGVKFINQSLKPILPYTGWSKKIVYFKMLIKFVIFIAWSSAIVHFVANRVGFQYQFKKFYLFSTWPPFNLIIKLHLFWKFKKVDYLEYFCQFFLFLWLCLLSNIQLFLALVNRPLPLNNPIKIVARIQVWWPWWPVEFADKIFSHTIGQPFLNQISRVRWGPILLKTIFFIAICT